MFKIRVLFKRIPAFSSNSISILSYCKTEIEECNTPELFSIFENRF